MGGCVHILDLDVAAHSVVSGVMCLCVCTFPDLALATHSGVCGLRVHMCGVFVCICMLDVASFSVYLYFYLSVSDTGKIINDAYHSSGLYI